MKQYTYLALGDSYTIGEQVPLSGCFPYQAVQLLRVHTALAGKNEQWLAPEIVAATGFTTTALSFELTQRNLLPAYDFVTLLIGVNNQYRGGDIDTFEKEFEILLKLAIQFAGAISRRVIVLSIPDWGVTPFAADRDLLKISSAIDSFNAICKKVALAYQTYFIDITTSQRVDGKNPSFLAGDELHPSANEYRKWAESVCKIVIENI